MDGGWLGARFSPAVSCIGRGTVCYAPIQGALGGQERVGDAQPLPGAGTVVSARQARTRRPRGRSTARMSYLSFEVEEERVQHSKLGGMLRKVGPSTCPPPAAKLIACFGLTSAVRVPVGKVRRWLYGRYVSHTYTFVHTQLSARLTRVAPAVLTRWVVTRRQPAGVQPDFGRTR